VSTRTVGIAADMVRVGSALANLPLLSLPEIAHAAVRYDSLDRQVEMQLATGSNRIASLCEWIDALPGPVEAFATEYGQYVRVEVVADIDGVRAVIWDHVRGCDAAEAGAVLRLVPDGERRAVPVAGLRRLAHAMEPADA
jgi:hypothetical protein